VTIGEVAAKATLATSAIRFYERSGLLKQPMRRNGRRVYSDDVLHPLVIIEFAKETGFTLSEIRLLLHGFSETTPASARWRKWLARKSMNWTSRWLKRKLCETCWKQLLRAAAASLSSAPRAWNEIANGGAGAKGRNRSLMRDEPLAHQGDDRYANVLRSSGRDRRRLPVLAAMAFAIAGANGGTPGSPIPVGLSVDFTMWTSTFGISRMRVGS
jgi:DNA-binding transcriptional MerR regulator